MHAVTSLVVVAVAWALVESSWAERWVETRVAKSIKREVQIDNIHLRATWPPTIELDKLRIGNPDWAKNRDLVDAEGVSFTLAIAPLFARRIVLPSVSAKVARASLEQKGGKSTWKFDEEQSGPSRIDLERVLLEDGRIAYLHDEEKTALDFLVKGSLGGEGQLALAAEGTFRGEPAKGTASVPGLDANNPTDPVRITGKADLGRTKVSADGTFETDFSSYDIKLGLAGSTMKDLHRVFGLVLPDTPPYKLDGRLRHQGNEWQFDPFSGKVGDSDLRGTVVYTKGGTRPMFRANLQSALLDFDDLGPIVGAPPKTGPGETASAEQKVKAAQLEVSDRVLPRQGFDTRSWKDMDADVQLTAKRVLRPKQLPVDSLATHIVLTDGVMNLQPLDFGIAGGRVRSNISVDSNTQPPLARVKTDVQGVKLAQLFPTLKTMEDAFGTVYGKADLRGRGTSIGELLGSSNGKIVLAANGGRVSDFLTQLLEIDLARAAMLLGTRNQQVVLRCAVGDFNLKDGVATPESFVVDTTETLVRVEGTLDFAHERFDLIARGRGKSPSLFTLKSPIVLEGPLRKPSVHPKAGPIVAQVGAAVVLAAVAPPLAIAAFVDPGRAKDADCDRLLMEAKAEGAVKKAS